jgi:5-dehydro-2-deoxygluconokinase
MAIKLSALRKLMLMNNTIVAVGRVSVDLYGVEAGAAFSSEQTFSKSVGGSPSNVAVAAAKLGNQAVLLTKVGADPLGQYVVNKLSSWGVDTKYVSTEPNGLTPVVLAALDPPEDPKLIFHRQPNAPDTTIISDSIPKDLIDGCAVFWMSGCALAHGETAKSSLKWLRQRNRKRHTIIDLDYRPSFWSSIEEAGAAARAAIANCSVVVGNRTECEMAIGLTDPNAIADKFLADGVELAIVKLGAEGVMLATATERIRIAPCKIKLVCGLGSGDAFGGALAHGLIHNWPLQQIGEFANAAGAYVATKLTCADAMPTEPMLRDFIAEQQKI